VQIYIELIWLLNFLIDWMILLLTQSITRFQTKGIRIILASFFGSLIVPINILFPSLPSDIWSIKLFHSILMVWLAFGFKNLAVYLKMLATFYFMTFAIGGGLFAVHYLSSSSNYINSQQTIQNEQIHIIFVLVAFPIVYLFTKHRMDKHKLLQHQQSFYYQVTIDWKKQKIATTGYMDSGNHLIDPLTQTPVIIVGEALLQHWLEQESIDKLKQEYDQITDGITTQLSYDGFRLLPYQGVSGEYMLMLVFKPNSIHIHLNERTIKYKKVLIGIQFGNLVADGSYHCLLHPNLLKQIG